MCGGECRANLLHWTGSAHTHTHTQKHEMIFFPPPLNAFSFTHVVSSERPCELVRCSRTVVRTASCEEATAPLGPIYRGWLRRDLKSSVPFAEHS